MTREEYLENHFPWEGADLDEPVGRRCPECGNEECEILYTRNYYREIVGCDRCVEVRHNDKKDIKEYYKDGEFIGDEDDIEPIDGWGIY